MDRISTANQHFTDKRYNHKSQPIRKYPHSTAVILEIMPIIYRHSITIRGPSQKFPAYLPIYAYRFKWFLYWIGYLVI